MPARLASLGLDYAVSVRRLAPLALGCLSGSSGDAPHAVLCAVVFNIRWLLRAIAAKGLAALLLAFSQRALYAARVGRQSLPERVRSMTGCAPSMGATLWGASPLWEYRLGLVMRARITTSRRQGQAREGLSGGSRSARGARRRTETAYKAEGCEASWHMTAKPTGTQPTVNAALVHRQFAFLPGESCTASGACRGCKTRTGPHRDTKGPSAAASCPPRVEETAATTIEARRATGGNARRDGAEVSRRRSRWPGVGPLKG